MNKEKHYYVIKDEGCNDQLLVKLTQEEYNAIKFLIEWLDQDLYIYDANDIVKEIPND